MNAPGRGGFARPSAGAKTSAAVRGRRPIVANPDSGPAADD